MTAETLARKPERIGPLVRLTWPVSLDIIYIKSNEKYIFSSVHFSEYANTKRKIHLFIEVLKMALRNDETISSFGRRLYGLMEEKNISSPKELAKALSKRDLVHVKTRGCFNCPETNYNNAILSIEKKIVRHIKTGKISDQNGEYVLAYSSFFECSTDFILERTDIRTPNTEIRHICELLGLDEIVVNELIRCNKKKYNPELRVFNRLLTAKQFHAFLEALAELASVYEDPDKEKRLWEDAEKKYGEELLAEAVEHRDDTEEDNPDPSPELLEAIHAVNDIIDQGYETEQRNEFDHDVFRFRLLRVYNRLIDELYPPYSDQ